MNNIIILKAENYEAEKAEIEAKIKDNPWFVLDNPDVTLDQYLTYLHDEVGLKNRTLSRLKICRNISWNGGDVTVIDADGDEYQPRDMAGLLEKFPDGTHPQKAAEPASDETKSSEATDGTPDASEHKPLASIVIENNERKLLANIAQQLIYLAYPLAEIDIKRRKEFKDAERVRRFMQQIDELAQAAHDAVDNIEEIKIPEGHEEREKLENQKADALASYRDIGEKIARARNIEMTVAVAASKKTGKSVIVNCMIGQELAPTSLEMATPNSCIYRKSPDSQYHLIWDKEEDIYKNNPGKFRDGTYPTREDIHDAIDKAFKDAQKDKENKFLIPDMTIEYVTNGNNFESYTVHDTPGPDAAGTRHAESAKKAMQACDASIFAIDYSKYLTDDEEKYLATVKSIFEGKNKFHTLLFAINKLDQSLQDGGAKSRVKSIDFIRNRLISIDEKYADCIIFATSALDYFNTLTLEEAAKSVPEMRPLLEPDADWAYQARNVIKDTREDIDEDMVTVLSNLGSEAGKLEDLLGYKKVDLHTMQEFSGMPQMMSYLSYILQSKAREEIVNYIATTIDAQTGNINAIIDQSPNLLALLQLNNEEIERIREILEEYQRNVEKILDRRITQEDLNCASDDGYLKATLGINNLTVGTITFEDIIEKATKAVDEHLNNDNIKKQFWTRYSDVQMNHLRKTKNRGTILKSEIQLSDTDAWFEPAMMKIKKDLAEDEKGRLDELAEDLKLILTRRFSQVKAAGKRCQDKLKKENCQLILPELPDFDIDLPEPELPEISINVERLGTQIKSAFSEMNFTQRLGENFRRHGLRFWDYDDLEGMVNLRQINDQALQEAIDREHKNFYEMMDEAAVPEHVRELASEVGENSLQSQKALLDNFYGLNRICMDTVGRFMNTIDDRAYYELESSKLRDFLGFIDQINEASSRFMNIWELIKDSSQAEKGVTE